MENGKSRQDQRIEREAMWRRRIEEQPRSGMSIRAFCRREGMTEPSFYDWRRRLKESSRAAGATSPVGRAPWAGGSGKVAASRSGAPAFARVVVSEESDSRRGQIEIQSREGRLIRVLPGFDRATLIEALSAIEAIER